MVKTIQESNTTIEHATLFDRRLKMTRDEIILAVEEIRKNVPAEMFKLNNWVCFRLEPDSTSHSGYKKTPKNPRTHCNAKSNDPSTWGSFDEAAQAWLTTRETLHGVGFMFSQSPYFGVDIDDIGDKLSSRDFIGADMVQALHTYTEISPSGTGLHCLCIGELPPKEKGRKNDANKMEMYSDGRFFTLTGNVYANAGTICDCTETIKPFHEKYIEKKKPTPTAQPTGTAAALSDSDILEKAITAANGSKFKSLYYDGDTSAYNGDDSDADMALCGLLAFWTGKNAAQMDTLFRRSSLYRPEKWDRKTGAQTYGELTIGKAISSCIETYSPTKTSVKPNAKKQETADKRTALTVTTFEQFCNDKGYNFKYDVISRTIKYAGFTDIDNTSKLPNTAPTILQDELESLRYTHNTIDNIARCIEVLAARNQYNPVLELLKYVEWDGHDYLRDLYDLLRIQESDKLSRELLKKWLMQCYCLLHNPHDEPFAAETVLVLRGAQGIAKTRLFERLALKNVFFGEGATLDPNNKDSIIQNTAVWICELGELGSTMKSDLNRLKAFLTQPYTEFRPPFGRTTERHPRYTSFCATVNDEEFLIDDTGNRRWAVILLPTNLSLDYMKQVKPFNFLQLWVEIREMVDTALFEGFSYGECFRLTEDEKRELTERNIKFMKPIKGLNETRDVLDHVIFEVPANKMVHYKLMTATEFINIHAELSHFSAVQIGKCLQLLGYSQQLDRSENRVGRYYNLPYWL